MRSQRVLGISLGTKKIGTVILERQMLIDWQMKSFKGLWSPQKLQTICTAIETLSNEYEVTHIAIKAPLPYACSPAILQLLKEIKRLARKKHIPLYSHTLSELKQALFPAEKINKRQFIELALQKYPALKNEYYKERKNRNRYYEMLFEAVMVADMALHNGRFEDP